MKKLILFQVFITIVLMGLTMATGASATDWGFDCDYYDPDCDPTPSPSTTTPAADNWYVCKFVGTPNVDEVLQTGQNPIGVDENAIKAQTGKDTVSIGDEFPDAQGRSVVVAGPFAPPGEQPGPGVEICGVSRPTTTTSQPPPPPTTTSQPPPPPTTTTTTTTTTSSAPPPVTTTTEVPPPSSTSTTTPPATTSTTTTSVTSTTTATSTVPPTTTTTSTTTTPPPVVPPPAVTTTTTTTTAPPPTETQPPPPGEDNQPPPNQGPEESQPPPDTLNPPNGTAFTGPEDVVPIGLIALALLTLGSGLFWIGRKQT